MPFPNVCVPPPPPLSDVQHTALLLRAGSFALQNEPLFLRTYTDAEGEEEEDANLRLHNIVHSSLDVIGERKGMTHPVS